MGLGQFHQTWLGCKQIDMMDIDFDMLIMQGGYLHTPNPMPSPLQFVK